MLPEGWEEIPLHEAANYRRGSFPQPYGLAKWFDKDNGFPFVQVFDISDSLTLKPTTKTKISRLAAEQSVFAPKGSILVSLQGSIGRVAISQYDAYVDRTVLIITGYKKPVDNLFFALVLEVLFAKEKELAPGGTIKTITKSTLNNFTISLPPLPEQKKIAAILSTWDRAIEGTEKLLANSQQQKKALIQQLLTGKKRLPGFTGAWKKVSLEKTGKVVSGGTPDTTVPAYWDGDVLWLTPTDVTSLRGKYVDDTKRKITQTGIKDSATTLLPAGSLLVCTRATIGYMAIAKKAITTNQGFKNIVFNKFFLPEFVYYFLCTQKHEMQRLASGSTFAEISKKDFCKIHISAPPLPEQKAIAAVLSTADEEITAIESDLTRLRQEKKALMQQLLTGKRRVKVD
ncbi:restriction endonuclease subunit S [Acetobacter pasteurianus]|uniref:restriction endonuclease subunit S n=1 Tax=Acetobacter pasteurianus TaxID=438 RepID=UPI003D12B607